MSGFSTLRKDFFWNASSELPFRGNFDAAPLLFSKPAWARMYIFSCRSESKYFGLFHPQTFPHSVRAPPIVIPSVNVTHLLAWPWSACHLGYILQIPDLTSPLSLSSFGSFMINLFHFHSRLLSFMFEPIFPIISADFLYSFFTFKSLQALMTFVFLKPAFRSWYLYW